MKNRIIFIGGGNMAEAIFAPLEQMSDLEIIVIQRNQQKLNNLISKYHKIKFFQSLDFTIEADDMLVLAIKPQDAKATCQDIKDKLKSNLIISVVAGLSTQTISERLNTNKIVRVMPNTASFIGLGVSGIFITKEVPKHSQELIKTIFNNVGKTYLFEDEEYIDKITPIAGSAIAYIFYIAEKMINSATSLFDFEPAMAKEITLQVIEGGLNMIKQNPNLSIEELRNNVTSKKGSTEKAIEVFDQANLQQILNQAETACYNRAKELGKL